MLDLLRPSSRASQAESAVATGCALGDADRRLATQFLNTLQWIDAALVQKVDEEGAATTVVRPIRVHALLDVTMPFLRLYFQRPCQSRLGMQVGLFIGLCGAYTSIILVEAPPWLPCLAALAPASPPLRFIMKYKFFGNSLLHLQRGGIHMAQMKARFNWHAVRSNGRFSMK